MILPSWTLVTPLASMFLIILILFGPPSLEHRMGRRIFDSFILVFFFVISVISLFSFATYVYHVPIVFKGAPLYIEAIIVMALAGILLLLALILVHSLASIVSLIAGIISVFIITASPPTIEFIKAILELSLDEFFIYIGATALVAAIVRAVAESFNLNDRIILNYERFWNGLFTRKTRIALGVFVAVEGILSAYGLSFYILIKLYIF